MIIKTARLEYTPKVRNFHNGKYTNVQMRSIYSYITVKSLIVAMNFIFYYYLRLNLCLCMRRNELDRKRQKNGENGSVIRTWTFR